MMNSFLLVLLAAAVATAPVAAMGDDFRPQWPTIDATGEEVVDGSDKQSLCLKILGDSTKVSLSATTFERITCLWLDDAKSNVPDAQELAIAGRFPKLVLLRIDNLFDAKPQDFKSLASCGQLSRINLFGGMFDGEATAALVSAVPTMESLTLADTVALKDGALGKLSKASLLRTLVLTDVLYSPRDQLADLASLDTVEELDAGKEFVFEEDDKFAPALANMASLKRLHLGQSILTDSALATVLENPSLVELKLHNCLGMAFESLPENPKAKLTAFSVSTIKDTGKPLIPWLVKTFDLESLTVSCRGLSFEDLKSLPKETSLKELDLHMVPEDVPVSFLSDLMKGLSLIEFGFHGYYQMDDEGWRAIAESKSIARLNMTYCDGITRRACEILATMPSLVHLDLSYPLSQSEYGLEFLIANAQALKRMTIKGWVIGRVNRLAKAITASPSIDELIIGDTNLTPEDRQTLIGARARMAVEYEPLWD